MTHVGRSRSTVTCWLSIKGRWMFSTKTASVGTADFADLEQIKGVLPHAGLPE